MNSRPIAHDHVPAEPGSAGATARAEPRSAGSRAGRPGSRRAFVLTFAALSLAALVVVSTRPTSSPAQKTHTAALTYGGLPSWLPKAKLPVGRVAYASAAHPWLAIEGDTVSVALPRGHAFVTVVGPQVPEEGKFPVPATTPCSFVITFAVATGVVPLRASAFTILDELGQLHHPRVTARGGGPVPARVLPGHAESLTVSGVLPTGNGQLRWAPGTAKPIASWDFDVEID